jgi:hypothetical protein
MEMRVALEHIAPHDIDELLRLLDAVVEGMLHAVESREVRY